ncbi:exocyst subunit SEC5 KNAG_0A04980 [Huiozyma naganishii CBS 8797]|uniref:Exocyst complex component SEC5 n=1 Tax=Huiozyma naganishii (strain ATCC MYA-139 / BCRC 22969 / CBS 8797 / KCTC 17520 / NBRC 10181 / NCYC 3082 / Yp74L-3) TaxID=1071383 RepID=J7S3T0_HUIN7|nr:hypothetical protein KNAG_0A04980 [Kazachstania naganishii CBS 8797]CCK68166.1 hypothetical protein KNAG_0A04980 [Kazachstania naganishii CBS 8797]
MNPFSFDESSLMEFYDLKTLNPTNSWTQDSTAVYNLEKWAVQTPDMVNSYNVLKDLMDQEQQQQGLNGMSETDEREIKRQLEIVDDPLRHSVKIIQLIDTLPPSEVTNVADLTQYLINNKNFNVKKFLGDIHNKDSFTELSQSLDILDQDIQNQANDLKRLVQENFTKYVKIKNRLDQIYKQFLDNVNAKDPSLNAADALDVDQLGEKVDTSVREITRKLKPLMECQSKLNSYQLARLFIEENKQFFNLPRTLERHISNNNYQSFISEYLKGKELYKQLKADYMESPSYPKTIDTIWNKAEQLTEAYRENTWSTLINNENLVEQQSVFLPLISKLLDLKLTENPIIKWINIKLEKFEADLSTNSERLLEKVIAAQRSIVKINEKISEDDDEHIGVNLSYYTTIGQLFSPTYTNNGSPVERSENTSSDTLPESTNGNWNKPEKDLTGASLTRGLTDSPNVIEMWLMIVRYVQELSVICNKFIDLWDHVANFLDGSYQNTIINEKKKNNILVGDTNSISNFKQFLVLEDDQIKKIRDKGELFVTLISGKLLLLFQSSQESLPLKQASSTKEDRSPQNYGFVPPNANGLSCLRYLPMIIEPLLRFATQLAQLGISKRCIETTRELVGVVINRSISAISATRQRDIGNFHLLEDWEVHKLVDGISNSGSKRIKYAVTQFPEIVLTFQQYSIKTIRDILYACERLPVINEISVVSYPSKKQITPIEIQQIISMETVLEAILKNAAKDKDNPRTSHTLLTLTNLQHIRETTFVEIRKYFDEAFECHLSDKKLDIITLLQKMEVSIFGNYLSTLKINLKNILDEKFHQIDWPSHTSNSFRISDYILESLMLLVTIHSECYRIGPQLIEKVLRDAQVFISRFLFEALKTYVGAISSDGLLQITVDLIFFQKILGSLLEPETKATLRACLQDCFQNKIDKLDKCINDVQPIVDSNIKKTSIQFAAFQC